MGRLKTLLSHTRNMDMTMTENTIKYSIPIYSEKGHIGMFRGIEIVDHEIRVLFNTSKEEIAVVKDASLKIDKTPQVISFD
jgi:hypothetical protein